MTFLHRLMLLTRTAACKRSLLFNMAQPGSSKSVNTSIGDLIETAAAKWDRVYFSD